MALYGPATLPPPPPDSAALLMGEQEQEPRQEPEPGRLGGRFGGGQCRATLGTYEQTPIPTIHNPQSPIPNPQSRFRLPNYRITGSSDPRPKPRPRIHRERPRNQKSRCHPRLPVVCRGAVRLGWRDRRAPWMARTSLHGRTCGVSRQPNRTASPVRNRQSAVAVAPAPAPAPASAMRSIKKTYTTSKQARTGAKLRRCCGQGP